MKPGGSRIIPRFVSKIGWLGSNEMSETPLALPTKSDFFRNTKHDVTAGLMNDLLRHHECYLNKAGKMFSWEERWHWGGVYMPLDRHVFKNNLNP